MNICTLLQIVNLLQIYVNVIPVNCCHVHDYLCVGLLSRCITVFSFFYLNILYIYIPFLDVYKIQTVKILVIHLYSVKGTGTTFNSLYPCDQIPD